jgi:hypothetical protein
MTDVKYAELHTPIFLAGTNLGAKLDPHKRTGLTLHFDEDKKRLIVGWNGATACVPEPNCSMWIEGKVVAHSHVAPAPVVKTKVTAQADSPQSHVFAGPGGGKYK